MTWVRSMSWGQILLGLIGYIKEPRIFLKSIEGATERFSMRSNNNQLKLHFKQAMIWQVYEKKKDLKAVYLEKKRHFMRNNSGKVTKAP